MFEPQKIIEQKIEKLYSQEAERALLGSVIISPEKFYLLDIEPEEFYIIRNRFIWEAFKALAADGKDIDVISVSNVLKNNRQLEEVGGGAYLMGLVNETPSSMNAETYAEIIREHATRRNALSVASEIAKAAYDKSIKIENLIPYFSGKISATSNVKGEVVSVETALKDLFNDVLERYKNPQAVFGMPSGLPDYDTITGGLHKGELVVLSGEPGVGKSILGCQMGYNMAQKNHTGVIYEMEMGMVQTTRRLLSAESEVPSRLLRNGKVEDHQWEMIAEGMKRVGDAKLLISDFTGWTTASLRANLSKLKSTHNIEWFVLDYMFLLQDSMGKDESERLGVISKRLKQICKDLELSGIVIHSLNKGGIEGDPEIHNLRGSGQVGYDADIVLMMVKRADNTLRLLFKKFREDAADRAIKLVQIKSLPKFGVISGA